MAAGIISLVFGAILLVSPKTLKKLSKKLDQTLVHVEKKVYNLRVGIGTSLILASIMIFFVVYYLVRKY